MIGVVFRHELGRLARSAQSWVVAAGFAGLAGYLLLGQLERWIAEQDAIRLQDHAPGLAGFLGVNLLAPLAVVIGLLAPLYAMRAFADEFRERTWSLWQSSPVPLMALVGGKLAAVVTAMLLPIGIAIALVLMLRPFTPLDAGVVASSALGLLLCAAATASAGLYCSSLVRQPLAAAAGALALVLWLWLLGSLGAQAPWARALAQLSPGQHLSGFFQGYPRSADVLYFLLFTATFYVLTVIRLDALRHAGDE